MQYSKSPIKKLKKMYAKIYFQEWDNVMDFDREFADKVQGFSGKSLQILNKIFEGYSPRLVRTQNYEYKLIPRSENNELSKRRDELAEIIKVIDEYIAVKKISDQALIDKVILIK